MRLWQPPQRLIDVQVLQEEREHRVEKQRALEEQLALRKRNLAELYLYRRKCFGCE